MQFFKPLATPTKPISIAMVFLISASSYADQLRVNLSIGSIHSEDYKSGYRQEEVEYEIFQGNTTTRVENVPYKEYFDSSNPGIGVEIPLSKRRYFMVGLFDNSSPGTTISAFGGFGIDIIQAKHFALCAEAFIASGYEANPVGDLCARVNITANNRIKLHYAPGKALGLAADVLAFEYQLALQ